MKAGYTATWLITVLLCLTVGACQQHGPSSPEAGGPANAAGSGPPDFIITKTQPFTPRLMAYGKVQPVSVLPIAATEAGVIAGLCVRPGAQVQAGESIAEIGGTHIASLLRQNEANVRSAQAQLDAAEKNLAIEKQQLPNHLSTRQAVQAAESASAQARAALENAQSSLDALRRMRTITAPASGIVLSLSSTNGALVNAGQTILTLQPAGALWLLANYYGASLTTIHTGLRGTFAPADGTKPVPVRVAAILGALNDTGGEAIALTALGPIPWLNGEAGTVALDLAARPMVAVPTRALIVNQGKWWVLLRTAHGNQPREVIPGPTEGWNTWIKSGLAPGSAVIVNDAYLLFHAGIAEQYQIPD